MKDNNRPIPMDLISRKIFVVRGEGVMVDSDLAELYGVETGVLNRSVKRNIERFPEDFMFQLSMEEWDLLRCQIGISKSSRGGRRHLPYAFTEQGVSMLSSEARLEDHDESIDAIFEAIVQLISPDEKPKKQIGFEVKESKERYGRNK